jgi:hypothetical protein
VGVGWYCEVGGLIPKVAGVERFDDYRIERIDNRILKECYRMYVHPKFPFR